MYRDICFETEPNSLDQGISWLDKQIGKDTVRFFIVNDGEEREPFYPLYDFFL